VNLAWRVSPGHFMPSGGWSRALARGAMVRGRQVRCMEQEASFQETPRNGGPRGTSGLPGPLRRFADRLDEVRSAETVHMDLVGQVLADLAADEEFSVR
jgi:hypothetical protein